MRAQRGRHSLDAFARPVLAGAVLHSPAHAIVVLCEIPESGDVLEVIGQQSQPAAGRGVEDICHLKGVLAAVCLALTSGQIGNNASLPAPKVPCVGRWTDPHVRKQRKVDHRRAHRVAHMLELEAQDDIRAVAAGDEESACKGHAPRSAIYRNGKCALAIGLSQCTRADSDLFGRQQHVAAADLK